MSLRIGTRTSALALAQAQQVAARIPGAELVGVTTTGDRGEGIGDKARWTRELDAALLDGRIDAAVHSAKDVPGELPDGIAIAAVPQRADARDALVGVEELSALPDGAAVGTSSLRRSAQLLAVRPDLRLLELRGNVDTRLRKLADGEADALVLACAGLERLGRAADIGGRLAADVFVPAPGQGTLAICARTGDAAVAAELAVLRDPASAEMLDAERRVARALGATCRTPVGVHARHQDGRISVAAFVGLPDGSQWIRDAVAGDEAHAVADELVERLAAVGAGELIAQADAHA